MKAGCLFLLGFWVGTTFLYQFLLQDTSYAETWWVWVLMGLSATLVVAQLWSVILNFKRVAASRKPPGTWADGDFVAVSGVLQALGTPGKAPISGKDAVIVEYELKRVTGSGDNKSTVNDYSGFLMRPCMIQGQGGGVRLHGFPILTHFSAESYSGSESYQRVAEYLRNATLKEMGVNPLTALGELMEVLADDDGELQVDFVRKGALRPQELSESFSDTEDLDDGLNDGSELNPPDNLEATEINSSSPHPNSTAVAFAEALQRMDYQLQETTLSPGIQVTAFGTYRESKRAIDVGSALKNISHTLEPGLLEQVVRKAIIKSILGVLFWGGVCLLANLAIVPEVRPWVESQTGISLEFLGTEAE